MNRRTAAIVLEIIPLLSAAAFYGLILSPLDAAPVRRIIGITMLLAFLGFAFFLIGRRLAGGDKAVRVLGILDCLATAFVIGFYMLAIFSFGL